MKHEVSEITNDEINLNQPDRGLQGKTVSAPTDDQIRRAARRLYNGEWFDQRQILMQGDLNKVRHEDGEHSGTWIDASVFIPDADANSEAQ